MAKVALVTGAGSGIGRTVALAMLAEGYSVFLVGRRRESLEQTRAMTSSEQGRAFVVVADVSQPDDVDALFAEVRSAEGRLDVVFNNAGVNAPAALPDALDFEHWSKVIAVNLTGAFLIARGAFAMMRTQKPQGGRIINNGSVSAHVPRPNSVAYTCSKHAITGLTKSLSLDGRAFGIACSQVDIGNAATEMAAQIGKGVMQADGTVRAEPTMAPQRVAEAVCFMAALPLDTNVQFMTVMATNMPFIGRG